MIPERFEHWEYLTTLFEDAERTGRYVDPDKPNWKTYSIEFLRLYLAIGSEVDVVAKLLCEKISAGSKPETINEYRPIIIGAFPDMPTVQVRAITGPTHPVLVPWQKWQHNQNPDWWQRYNAVKHHRDVAFQDANLGNTLGALAGLMVLVGYLYADALTNCRLVTPGKILRFDRSYWCGSSAVDGIHLNGYRLPGAPKPEPFFGRK